MTVVDFSTDTFTDKNAGNPSVDGVHVALCTDTHYWPGAANHVIGDGRMQHQKSSRRIQQQLLTDLLDARPDFVFHLGDMTCGGGSFAMPADEFFHTLDQTHAEFTDLPMPVHALPGNHDCPPGGDWSYFEHLWGLQNGLGKTIDTPNARLVLLNTQGHSPQQIAEAHPDDPIYGWVNDAELARVEDALRTADRPVLLFMHQLLRPWSDRRAEWKDFYAIQNGCAVLDLMVKYGNVRAVFQGHAHMYDVQTTNVGPMPCTFVVLPAIIEYPMAWLSLTICPDVLRVQCRPLRLTDLTRPGRCTPHAWRRGCDEWQDLTIALG